jgi:methylglutaconyl-CoA hydratase
MSDSVQLEIDQRGVATVTLNRPEKHNAFDDFIIAELNDLFMQIDANDKIKVMVLAANGKNFSAGGDLNWMKRMVGFSYDENLADAKKLAAMLHALNTLSIPTIARVQGSAFGGAVGLVSCCDMAVASDNASFCLSEVKVGIAPATIAPYVVAAIGSRASRRYFLTAERFSAQRAQELGLVSEVTNGDLLDDTLENLINALLANSPNALKVSKKLVREVEHQHIDSGLMNHTSQVIAELRVSAQGQEGLSAFFAKRSPSWQQNSSE